jgi:thiol-disulfide isomerase/thioredoxin
MLINHIKFGDSIAMKKLFIFFFGLCSISVGGQKPFPDSLFSKDMGTFDKIISGYQDPGWLFDKFSAGATNGSLFTNDSLKNRVSFINFWFEGCHPCVAEFPALNELYSKYRIV